MMKNDQSGLPIFLENTPSVMCDQVLWLIKNSGLNFQIKETPFSLDINLKKRFANIWNHNYGNPVSNQLPPRVPPQNHHEPKHDFQQNNSEFLCRISSLEANLEEVCHHKNEASKELLELDKAHRKLVKENKDLLKKHEQVCSDLRVIKVGKESFEKEKSSLSVALKTSKKSFEESQESFMKERNLYKIELEKLNQFKLEKDAELKANRKAEKKMRQKSKKEAAKVKEEAAEQDVHIKTDPAAVTPVNVNEDIAKEDATAKAEYIELPRTILKPKTKHRTQKVCDASLSNDALENTSDNVKIIKPHDLHPSDVFKEAEGENSEVVKEASETSELTSVSSFSNYSGSAPLTKSDVEECLKMISELYKT